MGGMEGLTEDQMERKRSLFGMKLSWGVDGMDVDSLWVSFCK